MSFDLLDHANLVGIVVSFQAMSWTVPSRHNVAFSDTDGPVVFKLSTGIETFAVCTRGIDGKPFVPALI